MPSGANRSNLCLFGFVYPSERARIPDWVMNGLIGRLDREMRTPPPTERICHGTLISREQYLIDIGRWDFKDARLIPAGAMTHADVAHWTRAIDDQNED